MPDEPVTGSVELTNARLYYAKPKNGTRVACDQFAEWLHIPASVIDPSDWKRLVMLSRTTKSKNRPGTTIRVLRSWYLKTKAALAIVDEGAIARVPAQPQSSNDRVKVNGGLARTPVGLTAGYYSFGR